VLNNPLIGIDPDGMEVVRVIGYGQAVNVDASIASQVSMLLGQDQKTLWDNRASNRYPVAPPGHSNHNSGEALDIKMNNLSASQRVQLVSIANSCGFRWSPSDAVHFYVGSRSPNQSLVAENRAHPEPTTVIDANGNVTITVPDTFTPVDTELASGDASVHPSGDSLPGSEEFNFGAEPYPFQNGSGSSEIESGAQHVCSASNGQNTAACN